jgi:hypothetical protein
MQSNTITVVEIHTYTLGDLTMQRFVIEREFPGAGKLSAAELQSIAKTSNAVIRDLGPGIQWEHSYVTGDKIYCVYLAKDEQMIREHAKRGGFPCNVVNNVVTVIDPLTEKLRAA